MTADKAQRAIRYAWIAAVVSGTWTLVFLVLAVLTRDPGLGQIFDAWAVVDVLIAYSLTFGIYHRSRTCALLMLIYFVGSQLLVRIGSGVGFGGVVVSIVLAAIFARGAYAAFAYHRAAAGDVSTSTSA